MGTHSFCTITWTADPGTRLEREFGAQGKITCTSDKVGRKLFRQLTKGADYELHGLWVFLKKGDRVLSEVRHQDLGVAP